MTHKRPKIETSAGATLLALFACYGTLAFVSIFALAGIIIPIDNGWWAISIVTFYGLAVIVIAFSTIKNRSYGPAILGLVGLIIILWAMFGIYHWAIELAAFVLLIAAAIWDRSAKKTELTLP